MTSTRIMARDARATHPFALPCRLRRDSNTASVAALGVESIERRLKSYDAELQTLQACAQMSLFVMT